MKIFYKVHHCMSMCYVLYVIIVSSNKDRLKVRGESKSLTQSTAQSVKVKASETGLYRLERASKDCRCQVRVQPRSGTFLTGAVLFKLCQFPLLLVLRTG